MLNALTSRHWQKLSNSSINTSVSVVSTVSPKKDFHLIQQVKVHNYSYTSTESKFTVCYLGVPNHIELLTYNDYFFLIVIVTMTESPPSPTTSAFSTAPT